MEWSLVNASGRGLEPDISPGTATYQVRQTAGSHAISEDAVRRLVATSTLDRAFGLTADPRDNILDFNLALAAARQRAHSIVND